MQPVVNGKMYNQIDQHEKVLEPKPTVGRNREIVTREVTPLTSVHADAQTDQSLQWSDLMSL
jgi:hypothetical protein